MRKTLIALTLVFTALAAACGDDDSDDTTGRDEAPATDATDATDAPEPAAAPTIQVSETGIGEVLADGAGKTLYLYAADQGTTSAVPANVLAAWPPLTVASEDELVPGEGLDDSLLEVAGQPDGPLWVTYNGHLLYTFTGDAAPGDTSGHRLGNVWYAVTPAGEQAA